MKHTPLRLAAVLALFALLAACGMSKADLERGVASRFQADLDNDANLSGYGMKVKSVRLMKSGSNTYNGYVTVALGGESHDIGITVTTDGFDYMCKTDQFAFSFLAPKVMEKAFKNAFDW